MKQAVNLAALTALAAMAALAVAGPARADALDGIRFLLGTWNANSREAQGTDIFQLDLDGRVLQRRSVTSVSGAYGQSADPMQALLTVYPTGEADSLQALYLDNAGHTIQYTRVTVTPGQRIEFRSDDAPSRPSFRLTYSLKSADRLHVLFEMRPPGHDRYRVVAESDESLEH
jgi:hypothetical protein